MKRYRILTLSGGLFLGFAFCEIALRRGGFVGAETNIRLDPQLGWTLLRLPHPPSHDKHPIVFIGDSFTAPVNGYVKQVNDEFRRAGASHEVINLGVSGYGTVQELEVLKKHGWSYHPSAVMVAIFLWNDLSDNVNEIYYHPLANINRPAGDIEGDTLIIKPQSLLSYGITQASQYIYLLRFVNFQLLNWKSRHKPLFFYTSPLRWYPLYASTGDPRTERAYQVLERLLARLKEEASEHHVPLFIVGFDCSFTIEREAQKLIEQDYPSVKDLDLGKPMRRLTQIAKHLDIPLLNLEEIFLQHKRHSSVQLYDYGISGHFTSEGERIAAKAIATFLNLHLPDIAPPGKERIPQVQSMP